MHIRLTDEALAGFDHAADVIGVPRSSLFEAIGILRGRRFSSDDDIVAHARQVEANRRARPRNE